MFLSQRPVKLDGWMDGQTLLLEGKLGKAITKELRSISWQRVYDFVLQKVGSP